jgi:DNA polymerase-3 subunit alpha
LVKAGALDEFGERGELLANTEEVLEFVREHFKAESSGQNSLFGKTMQNGTLRLRKVEPVTKEQKLLWEKEHLGMYVSAHPLDAHRNVLSKMPPIKSLDGERMEGNITLGGIVTRLKRTITKKSEPMAFFTLQDFTGSMEVLVFPKAMEKALPYLDDDKLIQVSGRMSSSTRKDKRPNGASEDAQKYEEEELKLIAEEIKDLPTDEAYAGALSEVQKKQQLVIHLQIMPAMPILNQIKEIFQKHLGNAQVLLSVGVGAKSQLIKTQTLVNISEVLIAELKVIDGVGKVDVV